MSLAFDYTNSKSIPISIQPSKNYDGKKKKKTGGGGGKHPKNSWFSPPASIVSLSLSIFNSPLRYFLHPSKAAVIINESLPVHSALCMRALPLKAEGNGGGQKRRGYRWHMYTHTNTLIHIYIYI